MIIRFYVEHTTDDVTGWEKMVAQDFGGFTRWNSAGCYVDKAGQLVEELSRVYEIVTSANMVQVAHGVACVLAGICGQETVLMVCFTGESFYCEPTRIGKIGRRAKLRRLAEEVEAAREWDAAYNAERVI